MIVTTGMEEGPEAVVVKVGTVWDLVKVFQKTVVLWTNLERKGAADT